MLLVAFHRQDGMCPKGEFCSDLKKYLLSVSNPDNPLPS